MSNTPLMSTSDDERAPWNEKDGKKTVRKKISVVLTKEIEVEVDANREVDNEEILLYYRYKYADPIRYIREFKAYSEGCKDKLTSVDIEGKDNLIKIYNKDIEGANGWETETIEIDDV